MRPGGALFDVLDLERLHEAVERLLVGRLHAEEDEAEARPAHEPVVLEREAAEAHVAVDAHLLRIAAPDHLVAERPQPVAHGEGAGVVHNLLHAVARDEVADLVHHVDRVARAVGGVERRPAAERAFRVPAVAPRHEVGAGRLAEVAVFVGVEPPAAEVAVDPRCRLEVVVEPEAPRVAAPVPDAGLEAGGVEARGDEVEEEEVPVAAGEDVVDGAVFHRLVGERGHVVAHEDDLRGARRMGRLEGGDPRPVALDDGGLRLQHHDIRREGRKAVAQRLRRPFLGDAVQPRNLVPGLLQHRRRRRGHDGEDVGGAREPLELAVLREERHALLARQRRIADRDAHGAGPFTTCSRGRACSGSRSTSCAGRGSRCSPSRSCPSAARRPTGRR